MPRDYRDEHDFTIEDIPGLPEPLPPGEAVLWQGRPRTWALACQAFWLHWVAGWFAAVAAWRVAASWPDMGARALVVAGPYLVLGLVTCAILLALAWAQARCAIYTITTARVAMRIGAALTLTVNLPFARIGSADMARAPGGTGNIVLTPVAETRLGYYTLWPHVRPRHMRDVKPMLRCVPQPDRVAAILSDAARAHLDQPRVARVAVAAE